MKIKNKSRSSRKIPSGVSREGWKVYDPNNYGPYGRRPAIKQGFPSQSPHLGPTPARDPRAQPFAIRSTLAVH